MNLPTTTSKTSHKRVLPLVATALCLGVISVGCSHQPSAAEIDKTVSQVRPVMQHLKETKKMDQETQDYLTKLENSKSFTEQARITPVLYTAVDNGAMTANDAIAIYKKMASQHPEDKRYWETCIKHFEQPAPTGVGSNGNGKSAQ